MTVSTPAKYDVEAVRAKFPILGVTVHNKPLVYLDNANTTQKPESVIEAISNFYRTTNSNIHRASHLLGEQATNQYEAARKRVQRFLNAREWEEIVFVRNATEGVNLIANTYGRQYIREGDEIILTEMEHHANIVPWQLLCERTGAVIKVLPVTDDGELDLTNLYNYFTPRTKLLGIVHMSNVLGTVNPVEQIIATAHEHGVPVLVDAAQSAYHMPIDVQAMDCDFLVFSGHKLYGPTGIGVLYTRRALLEEMEPWQGGGDMIESVSFARTIYNQVPYKFEAGTPHIAGAIGLGAAVDFIQTLGMENLRAYENELLQHGLAVLTNVKGLRLIGSASNRASVLSFTLDGVHPHDIGTFLDFDGIAIRTGQHCAHPLMQRLKVPATARASLGCYNTSQELDALAESLTKIRETFVS